MIVLFDKQIIVNGEKLMPQSIIQNSLGDAFWHHQGKRVKPVLSCYDFGKLSTADSLAQL